MNDYRFELAELFIRIIAGVLFLFQGYDKLFRVKMAGVINVFAADADRYHVPRPILVLVTYYTSVVEFIGGILLLLGLFTPIRYMH